MSGAASVRVSASPINWWDGFPLGGSPPPKPEDVLGDMQRAGYAGTELGGTLPSTPDTLKPMLDKYGLALAGGWFPSYLLTKPLDEERQRFVAFAQSLKAMGSSVVVAAEESFSITTELTANLFPYRLPTLTTEQWNVLCRGWEELQKIARDMGMTAAYHPHMGTIVIEGWQIARLLEGAPNLPLCVDTGHLAFAGVDPLDVMKRYADRIVHYHLKNIRPSVVSQVRVEPCSWTWAKIRGAFTVPGDGGLDFRPIVKKIADTEYKGWVVLEAEQNSETADPYLYAKLGRDYICDAAGW